MKHAYLLHTGYGKTKLCLDKIMAAPKPIKTLLISTKNIIETSWSAEIDKWYPGQIVYNYITGAIKPKDRLAILDLETDILGINVEMLTWYIKNTTKIKYTRNLAKGPKDYYNESDLIDRFDLLIIDESSLFKSYNSTRFELIKRWAHKVSNVIILSATPTPKDIEDMWSQIFLLDGGQRLGKNITEFRTNYAIAVPMSNGYNRYEYTQEATDEVLRLIKDICTSVPTPAKPLFPEPILKKVLIKPDDETALFLKTFRQDFIIQLEDGKELVAFTKTQLMNKVNQIASGNVYHKHDTIKLNGIKIAVLKQKLSLINTPVLIPYVFVFDREELLKLPGARLLSKKQDFLDWNNNLIPIGVISPWSAAHGLNLQDSDCERIIWFSPIFDTEKWIQLNARVCRRGQKKVITIEVLLLKGSYDDYAFDLCQDKFKAQYNNLTKLI